MPISPQSESSPILELCQVSHTYGRRNREATHVLEAVNIALSEGEIVAFLGQSGVGKSTLLRIMAGLLRPSTGQVLFRGQPMNKPTPEISMVFQNFALLPWMTVLQNVELALQRTDKAVRRDRALSVIDMVGLDGFESAYPAELSGGMCQRVGLARAMVMEPDVLLMDEAFSSLDVLTADSLRSDLLALWQSQKMRIKSMVIVTHSIEEAALMADRIYTVHGKPAQLSEIATVSLPHPRDGAPRQFNALLDRIYQSLAATSSGRRSGRDDHADIGRPLPDVEITDVTGLVDALDSPEYEGSVDLPALAEDLHIDSDALFTSIAALELLRFATMSEGNVHLTPVGKRFSEANILRRKSLFLQQLLRYVPLARYIRRLLDEAESGRMREAQVVDMLMAHMSERDAQETMRVIIEWGRYAELFAYHAHDHELSLEDPV